MIFQSAPEWHTTEWFNSESPLSLAQLRGKVVLLHAFQMLCPGCVANALPQAKRAAQLFAGAPLAVIGLHSVFEHHAVMGADALRAFLYEYRIDYPVGIDQPGDDADPRPLTMRAYAMQGTPTTILIDAEGRLRQHVFGACDDLWLGAELGQLLAEAKRPASPFTSIGTAGGSCAGGVCTPA
ncbi:MAG TPA: redoxin family protein [Rhodanobacteraceae bacterium]